MCLTKCLTGMASMSSAGENTEESISATAGCVSQVMSVHLWAFGNKQREPEAICSANE